jgi:hypothetical protein
MSGRVGINDPDDWIGWWLSLHPSVGFAGALTQLADSALRAGEPLDTPRIEILEFDDAGQRIEVEMRFIVESYPSGRVMHILSIRTEGDPLPPVVDA